MSDFGRTLLGNGGSTDHGWGGNHMIMGSGVRGGRVLGQFPAESNRQRFVTDSKGPVNYELVKQPSRQPEPEQIVNLPSRGC